jgi:hypothetical protein
MHFNGLELWGKCSWLFTKARNGIQGYCSLGKGILVSEGEIDRTGTG